uniref:DUF4781 domain-containing protein n=1 Tax=Glossina brevipalpis TaxID=37001 RepID=A0A1A9WU08_9MUSC
MILKKMFKKTVLKCSRQIPMKCYCSTTTFKSNSRHIPVLCTEAINYLNPEPQKIYIDMTFGAGGHCKKLLDSCKDIKVYALDRDPVAYELAQQMAKEYEGRLTPLLGRFSDLPYLLEEQQVVRHSVDGVLFDFGCSSMQFDEPKRGFSVVKNGPLDMRMDCAPGMNNDQVTAADVLARVEEEDLVKILRIYGEEKAAKKIARAIVQARSALHHIETTKQLADLVANCLHETAFRLDKLQRPTHVATKTFQALRIFVNNELNEINYGMILANDYLRLQGRLVAITFHSLEDTIVKRHLNGNVIDGLANPIPLKYCGYDIVHDEEVMQSINSRNWKQLHKHVILPSEEELKSNSRSRSAKLRAAVKFNTQRRTMTSKQELMHKLRVKYCRDEVPLLKKIKIRDLSLAKLKEIMEERKLETCGQRDNMEQRLYIDLNCEDEVSMIENTPIDTLSTDELAQVFFTIENVKNIGESDVNGNPQIRKDSKKTIRNVHQEIATNLGFDDQIIWDLLTADQGKFLEGKIRQLIPDSPESTSGAKGQRAIEEMRSILYNNIWAQRKYTNGTSLSAIFFVAITKEEGNVLASSDFSFHPVFRTRKCCAEDDSSDCCMIYIDETGRVYQSWESYIQENVLPDGNMVVPRRGIYTFDDNGFVVLDVYTRTQSRAKSMERANNTAAVVSVGAACVPLAALALPIAAPIMACAGIVAIACGTFSTVMCSANLVDRSIHNQSINITNREARGSWLGIGGGVVGATAVAATNYMTSLATVGDAASGLEILINGMNVTSIVLSGSGVANGILDLILKYQDGDEINAQDVMQLAASLVLFTHSVYNFRMTAKIVGDCRSRYNNSYRNSLKTQLRKIFNKLSEGTNRIRGEVQGRMDVIRNINDIPDRNNLMDLFKIGTRLTNKWPADTKVLGSNFLLTPQTEISYASSNALSNRNPNLDLPNSFPVVETTATILLQEFGQYFLKNIVDPDKFAGLMEYLGSKFPENIVRFLLSSTKSFIERYLKELEVCLKMVISTECILFRIFEYCYTKYRDYFNYGNICDKTNEITTYIYEYFMSMNHQDLNGKKIKCKKCKGFYTISKL